MNHHFFRGTLLMEQERDAEAVKEFQAALAESPDDPMAHGFLAILHARGKRWREAEEHAAQAVAIAPDESFPHYARAQMLLQRNRFVEAEAAVTEAIRLDPHDADKYCILAACRLTQQRWQDAVAATDSGLAIDPEHSGCANVRSQALLQLGDRAGAAAAIAGSLARNPDDATAHASQGWAALHENDPQAAVDHFREALRLEPGNDFARAGIVEALKARNPIYRWLLQYFLWMGRLPRGLRWGLVIGAFVGVRGLRQLADDPVLRWPVYLIIALYAVFLVLTWIGDAVFNLLLFLDPLGRHALDDDQRRGARLFGGLLLGVVALAIGGFACGSAALVLGAFLGGLTTLVATTVYRCDRGWPRWVTASAVAVVAALAAVMTAGLVACEWSGTSPREAFSAGGLRLAGAAFMPALLGTMLLSQIMVRTQVRH